MVCPFCLHKKTEIYNTRSTNSGTVVWRRRRCTHCQNVFTTEETNKPDTVWQVKKNSKLERYSRARLTMSILQACDHRLSHDDTAMYLFEAIEQKLYPIAAKNKGILTSMDIATQTSDILKRFDAAAYVKYISYHTPNMDTKTLRKYLRRP